MKKHYRHENDCLNCGTELQGKFCHHCGQENLQIKESFGHLLNHAVSDYFHFDHQFFHTLRPLFLKPGKLTNEYMAGRRTQYLHPIKMYIFISLVYFLLLFKGGKEAEKAKVESKPLTTEQRDSVKAAIKDITILDDKQKEAIQKTVDKKIIAKKKVNQDDDDERGFLSDIINADENKSKGPKTYEEYLKRQEKLPASERDNWLIRYGIKKDFDWNKKSKSSEEQKEIFWESFKHNVPKMMFVLLPLFALMLKITFYRNRKFYVEHLIYSIHLHCFLFLFLAMIMLLQMALPQGFLSGLIHFAAFITICWYLYRSLKVVYHRSRLRTITKLIGLSLAYSTVFGIAFVILLAITAATAA